MSNSKGRSRARAVGKQRLCPLGDSLRDWDRPKPIKVRNLFTLLNKTELLDNQNDHIRIKLRLETTTGQVIINGMVDSGATEDFINEGFGNKENMKIKKGKKGREIDVVNGRSSAMGPVTHMAEVHMDSGPDREKAILQVANLPNQEVILAISWLSNHYPGINGWEGKITVHYEQCTTWCHKESPTVYVIPKEEP